MTLHYPDPELGENVPVQSRMNDDDEHVPAHDVARLPGTVETDIGSSKTFLQTLAGAVAAGRVAVDLSSTALANLASLAGAIVSGRMAVDLSSAALAYLANLTTLATPPSAIYNGRKTITSAGNPAQIQSSSQALTEGVWVRALDANLGVAYVGNSSLTTANGHRLAARDAVFIRVDNLNKVYVDVTNNNEGVTFIGW